MSTLVVLLRGINVGGHKPVAMPRLREACTGLGFAGVQSYIQSGNLVVSTERSPDEAAALVAGLVKSEFGRGITVVVRTAARWRALVAANPFVEEAGLAPNRLMLVVGQGSAPPGVAEALAPRARGGERVAVAGGATSIHFPEGQGTSKLTPTVLDKAHGQPVTVRNWTTVLKLRDLASAPAVLTSP